MKTECLNYILSIMISDFISNASQEEIEKYKRLYPNMEWDLGFDKALKNSSKNKTFTKYIIEDLYKFMEQENLLGDFDL